MTKQINNEFIDKKNLTTVLKSHIPNLYEDKIVWHNDGWDFVVAVVGSQAFRFPRRSEYESKVPIEVAFVQQFIPLSPIVIPKLELHKNNDIGNYTSYEFLHGTQLKKDVSKTFTKENLLQIARQLGNFLSTLHSFPIDKAKAIGIYERDSLQSWTERFERIQNSVFPHLSQDERSWTTQIFTDYLQLIKNNPIENRVIHTDIMPEHIIVSPETQTLSGVIDFADTEICDPAYDFTYLRKYGQEFLEEAYKSYTLPRDPYFEKRRQFYEDRLVVTNLEHSIKVGDTFWIEKHKKELKDYLKSTIDILQI